MELVVNENSSITLNSEGKQASRRRSKVWDEYLPIPIEDCPDGKARVKCKHCKDATYLFDSHYGTSSVTKHLAKCEAYRSNLKKEDNIFDQRTYRELVAKAIIKHGYSFSWVEHEGNRDIHVYLNNEVKTICRNTAKADCLKLHSSLKSKLQHTLRNIPGRISLTSDMWTSCQTEGYLCLTAHYVNADWKLVSRVLNFRHIETPHTGDVMKSVILTLLQDWGISHKIFSITLDNASSNDKMQDSLRNSLNDQGVLLSQGLFFHIRCAAHVLNLIVKDGLRVIEHSVEKIRESVKFVKGSEARKNAFRQSVRNAGISATKALWLDVPTRWNSTYMMLDRALLYRNAFKELRYVDPLYKFFPEYEEWDMMEIIRDILEPFADITELFSGSDYPTANLYFENVWKIDMLLNDLGKSTDMVLRTMAISMRTKFDKYWAISDNVNYTTLFAFAVILDPRCKLAILSYCYRRLFDDETTASLKVSEVKCMLESLFKEYDSDTRGSSPSNSSTNIMSGSHKRKYDYLADFNLERSVGPQRTKLDVYLEDTLLDRRTKLDVLNFWRENESRYGGLSYLARDVLSVPLTTVASESTFSIGGRVLNKWRSSYLHQNVEALITARSWLYGYEPNGEDEFIGSDVEWNATKSKQY